MSGYKYTLMVCADTAGQDGRYMVFQFDSDLLTSGLKVGCDRAYTVDLQKFYIANSATTWLNIGSGAGGVTAVTGSSPLSSTGGTTPDLSIAPVSTSSKGSCPQLPGIAAQFLDGNGAWNIPAGLGVPLTRLVSTTSPITGGGDLSLDRTIGITKNLILLNELGAPTGAVDFNKQQASNFVMENRTSDPGSPVAGQIWLRTDL